MHQKLLSVFQRTEYGEDKVVNVATEFERLRFHRNTRYNPENVLEKVNENLKRTEVDNGTGNISKPVSDALLPGLFQAKIDNPTYKT